MASYKLLMPQMGESIHEATILKWMVEEGDRIEQDDIILEVATDKVDSEIPSPVTGRIMELKVKEGDLITVGAVIAEIEVDNEQDTHRASLNIETGMQTGDHEKAESSAGTTKDAGAVVEEAPKATEKEQDIADLETKMTDSEGRFYSPLVRTIARKEDVSLEELREIQGTGAGGKITKSDVLAYLDQRSQNTVQRSTSQEPQDLVNVFKDNSVRTSVNADLEEVVNMSRVRYAIARHMVHSRDTAAHVTSVIEADMTDIVKWRNRNKSIFFEKYGIKLTYTPIFINILAGLLREFPYLNASVEDNKVVLKKYINIGIATALPDHTLIVPVVKNADQYNLMGIARIANDLVNRARNNTLTADEIQQGTFTLTNIGTFDNLIGTPIINQPEVAILATGAIVKKPAVIETSEGDYIGIRHKMYLSLSFDHRVIDGYLGGTFLKALVTKLESFDEEDL
ncbi:2-oxo acid dehydrogenase subunit E2 [Membranicola marinus]|uniref:Dihydrolipoamide acetyltransferase component of pyruvate dehydrogenase complex n=1 Tax=Membranihabitans marinus TaxID=1227546 RepID=A0A953LCM4_9BACT|nr:dihydrolipoamide acetyltransferase family protein [Membranihabitans marinus]MBY5957944.1 2-oxo acid dehydrogenase subunit E2 [Membranihabitans marinus]